MPSASSGARARRRRNCYRPGVSRYFPIVVVVTCVGCAADDTLVIDLVTDLRAGVEWDGARVFVDGALQDEKLADAGGDYVVGERIFEGLVESGQHRVEVVLSNDGFETIRRPAQVRVSGTTGVTIVVSRECRSVSCPVEDPALEACLGGVCVEPSCTPETPELCPAPECTSDTDCGGAGVGCASTRCVEGSCIEVDMGSCGESQYCNFDVGCLDLPSTPDDDLRTGLVLWLPMDDEISDERIDDATGNDLHAFCTRTACPTPIAGRVGTGALAFELGQVARVPHVPALDLPDAFTLAVWVWIDATGTVVPVGRAHGLGGSNTWAFVRWDDAQSCFEHTTAIMSEDTCGGSFPLGEWVHVAGTWNGSVKRYYIDGVSAGTTASAEPVDFDVHDLLLGRDENSGSAVFELEGRLDDLRLYSRALTSDEIRRLARPGS